MTTEILSNLGVTTVGTTMASSSSTTLVVTAAVGALATLTGSQQCRVTVGSTPATAEIMIATAVSGTSITVTRGAEGTSGNQTAWTAGTPVLVSLTAASVQAVINQTALAGAATGTIAAVTLAPSSDATSAIGTSALRYTNVVTNEVQIFGAASDANPVYQNSSAGAVMGAGGASAVDVGFKRSAAGTLAVTNGGATNLTTIASALLAPGTDATQAHGSSSLRFTDHYTSGGFYAYTSATDYLAVTHTGLTFAKGTASPGISQSAQTTDTACNNLTLTPQAPWASASTNVVGGNVVVSLATPISGSGESNFQVTTGGSFTASLQLVPSLNTYCGLFLTPGITPSSTNYALISNGSSTGVNATGTCQMRVNGTTYFVIGTSMAQFLVPNLQVTPGMVTPLLYQATPISDVATTTFSVMAQSAYASATGTHQNGGNLILSGGLSTAAGSGVGGDVTMGSGVAYKTFTVTTATYTCDTNAQSGDHTVLCNRAGAITVTLPAVATTGREIIVTDISGAANTNNITISPASGNINGAASYVLNLARASVILRSDGSNWWVVGSYNGTVI